MLAFLLWKLDLSTSSVLKIVSYHLGLGTRGGIISMMKIQSGKNTEEHKFQSRNYPWGKKKLRAVEEIIHENGWEQVAAFSLDQEFLLFFL